MVDTETLALSQDAVIVELAACCFELNPDGSGKILSEDNGGNWLKSHFHTHIGINDRFQQKRVIDRKTMLWWMSQAKTFDPKWASGTHPDLFECLRQFTQFIINTEFRPFVLDKKTNSLNVGKNLQYTRSNRDFCIWSHGSSFDLPMLQHALEQCSLFNGQWNGSSFEPLWHYRNIRDTRTLFDLADFYYEDYVKHHNQNKHSALDDTLCQANAVIAAWAQLHTKG